MSDGLLIVLVMSALLGVAVPSWGMRMIVPSLTSAEKAQATNFRGRKVFYGLGITWLIWAGCAIIAGIVASSLLPETVLPILTLAGPLALVAFALGLVDDAYGSSSARGFKGHVTALLKGRLTTGGMKLVGIGLASLVVALIVVQVAPWGDIDGAGGRLSLLRFGTVLLAGTSVALTSNLLNLLDLRPGRALKAYGLLVPFAVASAVFGLGVAPGWGWLGSRAIAPLAVDVIALLLFLLGPALSVWRFDLAEEGMMGDAGANPMGAVVGLVLVSGLPLWGLWLWTLLVLGLNIASERVSFSAVIEGNALLKRLDAWGRKGPDTESESEYENATGDTAARLLEESPEIKSGK